MSTPTEKARGSPSKRMVEMSVRDSISPSVCCSSRIIGRSMTLRGGLISFTRATGAATLTLTRLVAAVAIVQRGRTRVSPLHVLDINRRLARLGNRGQRIARALFFFDPLLFVADDVEQQLFVLRAGQILFTVLLVSAIVQRFTGFAVVFLPCPSSNVAVEVDIWRVELLFARLQERVQLFD